MSRARWSAVRLDTKAASASAFSSGALLEQTGVQTAGDVGGSSAIVGICDVCTTVSQAGRRGFESHRPLRLTATTQASCTRNEVKAGNNSVAMGPSLTTPADS